MLLWCPVFCSIRVRKQKGRVLVSLCPSVGGGEVNGQALSRHSTNPGTLPQLEERGPWDSMAGRKDALMVQHSPPPTSASPKGGLPSSAALALSSASPGKLAAHLIPVLHSGMSWLGLKLIMVGVFTP